MFIQESLVPVCICVTGKVTGCATNFISFLWPSTDVSYLLFASRFCRQILSCSTKFFFFLPPFILLTREKINDHQLCEIFRTQFSREKFELKSIDKSRKIKHISSLEHWKDNFFFSYLVIKIIFSKNQ